MEGNMFCYQCQEAAKGTGCVLKGVCGKNSSTARYMDLLLFTVRGVSVAASALREQSVKVSAEVDSFVTDALFSTITNANFDDESILRRVEKGIGLRDDLKAEAAARGIALPGVDELEWKGEKDSFEEKAAAVGVLREANEDLRSLKELLVYGLKGMAAYHEHAMRLGYSNGEIHAFMQAALAKIAVGGLTADEWVAQVMQAGEMGVKVMHCSTRQIRPVTAIRRLQGEYRGGQESRYSDQRTRLARHRGLAETDRGNGSGCIYAQRNASGTLLSCFQEVQAFCWQLRKRVVEAA